ncbi:hypothetical protein [Isosphaera pallida]|uniref:hypothetical protein n=1 Tax=Isosphaera pallida TaxID=128 RepID=UPI00143C5D47|nr:hypothetical protein [Isosphaera pallida]
MSVGPLDFANLQQLFSSLLSDNVADFGAVQNLQTQGMIQGVIGEDQGFVVGTDDVDLDRWTAPTNGFLTVRTYAS